MNEFAGPATKLLQKDVEEAANNLRCDAAIVRAVCDVESAGSGFLPDCRPRILFEAHLFYGLTHGRFGLSNISSPSWDRSLYGAGGAHQYERLSKAVSLDRVSALKSCSWGMFQILGKNHKLCGYSDVLSFVFAMVESERNHLDAFAKFAINTGMVKFLQEMPPDFAGFARLYNGQGYAANRYDMKLAAAWRKYRSREAAAKGNPAPRTNPTAYYETLQLGSYGDGVSGLQRKLVDMGAELVIDGDFGPITMAAVVSFQRASGLVPDGIVGPRTRSALGI